MLEIQRFIIENPNNWKEKLEAPPFNLKIKEKGNLVLFKYNQLNSDFSKSICQEARGLILEKESWRVVRMAFYKFFNYGEDNAAFLMWNHTTATQKEDGTLISLYYYKGWRIATNSNIDAADAPLNNGNFKTFEDLFLYTLNYYPNFDWNKLDPEMTYTMELCSPYNQIVCIYTKPELYLTCVRSNVTLLEEPLKIFSDKIGIPTPTFYEGNSIEDYEKIIAGLGENTEGIVVRDVCGERVKMKTQLYFELHHTINNGIVTLEKALTLILANDHYEFLSYFPRFKEYFDKVQRQYQAALQKIKEVQTNVTAWQAENPFKNRKDFSDWVRENYSNCSNWAYLAYENKLEEVIKNKTAKQLISFLRLEVN